MKYSSIMLILQTNNQQFSINSPHYSSSIFLIEKTYNQIHILSVSWPKVTKKSANVRVGG